VQNSNVNLLFEPGGKMSR